MRSAETSGVEVKGFGTAQGIVPLFRGLARRVAGWLRRLTENVNATGLAVAVTALCAATIAVTADAARTILEKDARQRQLMHVAAAEPAAVWRYDGATMTTLAGPAQDEDAIGGILHRAAGALALALGVAAVALRRRKAAATPATGYDSIIAALPFGVACWDAEGRLVSCNAQYRARVAVEGPELTPGATYSTSVKRLVQGGYMQLVKEDDDSRLLELRRDDGSCLMIDERPLPGGGFVTLVTDITESRRTHDLLNSIREEQRQLARRYHEEKLKAEAASRSKTTFLAHLSHDIRTPLNHIIGFADMMRQQAFGPLGDRRYLDYVNGMKDSGERLLGFFASILELAELESGQKPMQVEQFEIDDMLSAVTRRFAGQAQRAGLSLKVGAPCGARLVGDRFAIERMVGNILENAVRFTQTGGKVSVAAYAAADGVVLEITDTGIGMGPERLEALSQPFAFGDAALARQHGGAGLGIAIARAIAELSGGRLAIDSRPALGTTVAISLPLRAAATTQVRAA